MTHHGSCHCGLCAYAADIDLAAGTTRCNCTFCRKARAWGTRADTATFRVTRGADHLRFYDREGSGVIRHAFCGTCGTRLFAQGHIPEMGGDFVTISVASLDDVSEEELIAAPVTWCDGLHDAWWFPPAEIRHL